MNPRSRILTVNFRKIETQHLNCNYQRKFLLDRKRKPAQNENFQNFFHPTQFQNFLTRLSHCHWFVQSTVRGSRNHVLSGPDMWLLKIYYSAISSPFPSSYVKGLFPRLAKCLAGPLDSSHGTVPTQFLSAFGTNFAFSKLILFRRG